METNTTSLSDYAEQIFSEARTLESYLPMSLVAEKPDLTRSLLVEHKTNVERYLAILQDRLK